MALSMTMNFNLNVSFENVFLKSNVVFTSILMVHLHGSSLSRSIICYKLILKQKSNQRNCASVCKQLAKKLKQRLHSKCWK